MTNDRAGSWERLELIPDWLLGIWQHSYSWTKDYDAMRYGQLPARSDTNNTKRSKDIIQVDPYLYHQVLNVNSVHLEF